MSITVGLPRALLYHDLFPMWETFFQELGIKIVVSPPTNKKILAQGLENTVDEACLPVKAATGHVLELTGKADYIFVPRLVSLSPREYICPKFLGFPDMVKGSLKDSQRLIEVDINLYRPGNREYAAYKEIGNLFTGNPLKIHAAYRAGRQALQEYQQKLQRHEVLHWKKNSVPTVAVIGHGYNIYDNYISMDVINKLKKRGAVVVTPENLPEEIIRREAAVLPKKMFWTLGSKLIGAALYFSRHPGIAGIIHVTSFGCGPDSLVGELIERYLYRLGKVPFMKITLDEHAGEAGVVTRLEAFLDMIQWKARKNAL